MLSINKRSITTFQKLMEGLSEVGDSKKIDNAEGAFMPVWVEIIGKPDLGAALRDGICIVSVAHYFEQHGDLCADPEMTFLVGDGAIYPMTFRQDNIAYSEVAMFFDEGKLMINEEAQTRLVVFAQEWLSNIAEQQNL
ncbi:MAG: hypothetical protein RIC55_14210 [Pirellulaceae bacterium]